MSKDIHYRWPYSHSRTPEGQSQECVSGDSRSGPGDARHLCYRALLASGSPRGLWSWWENAAPRFHRLSPTLLCHCKWLHFVIKSSASVDWAHLDNCYVFARMNVDHLSMPCCLSRSGANANENRFIFLQHHF